MIVKILSHGTSFKGLATYLTHDPAAQTTERVGWTHTLNLAHDDAASAVDEMLWTARNAELLKQEAGIRAGGRATENAVKHVSLNWSPEENPSRQDMIDATEEFLQHMKWQEHQALLVAHEDKAHAHVHVMLNTVHPETGLRLDDNFERRRAQSWALEYEREHDRIYCEERLKNPAEREDSLPRPAWLAFQENEKSFERAEKILSDQDPILFENPNNAKIANFAEWKYLKEIQRQEREDFFAHGKSEFSELRRSVYREVREEFRERWQDFYEAQRGGGDGEFLADLKAELIADQKVALESRRDEACQELRESRDTLYRELLDEQRDIRHGLRARQEAGLDNALFLQLVEEGSAAKDRTTAFREAAESVTVPPDAAPRAPMAAPRSPSHGIKSGADVSANIATGLGFGLLALFDSLADGLIAANPDPHSQPRQAEPEPPAPNPFDAVIEEARQRQQHELDDSESEWRKRLWSLGD